ncbi:hypothetical protein HAN_2g286 (nucleomorph) [Hemiselmis andersenii]|uniref:RING-type domain-containing protein n=2 Tax=Hemiselmis andersenii TaxID=464988 RepID=A9BKV3_HEMAN|nr:hypothetical protein HAN_2g286 [Hemiselmis andersenii]ABW98108.1 hypothetical protein HAN_2g286 [Hemiselmis andersenii]|mmetsp:Transcript_27296/g.66493  ORF Transcript_27296/g.66493 Transcript_27296/m.66493 type:complete len:512 (+) Transcript_27296:917-2452(+)
MNVFYRIFLSFFSTVLWGTFFLNFFDSWRKKNAKNFLDKISQRNLLNIVFFLKFFDFFFTMVSKKFFKFFEEWFFLANCRQNLISFFLNLLKNRVLLQELKEAIMECFFVLIFSSRQFSFYSSLIFGSFILTRTVQQIYLQNLKIQKPSKKNFSSFQLLSFFTILFSLTFFETIVVKVYLAFNRRRIVNLIIGTEVLFLTSSIKESIIDHAFFFIDNYYFDGKWSFQGGCELFLKIWVSFLNLFSYILSLNNISISKKGIFKYYILRRAFQCGKEFFQNFEEYSRYRKTQVFIGTIMKNPTEEEIFDLSDNVCIVCRDEMDSKMSKKLPCKHILHTLCLQDWLRRQFSCPICMTTISSSLTTTAKQNFDSDLLSLKKTNINSIAFSFGFTRNNKISKNFKKNHLNSGSLPTLFPDPTNLFFWANGEKINKNGQNKKKIFESLIHKNFLNFKNGFNLKNIEKEYFQILWFEKKSEKFDGYFKNEFHKKMKNYIYNRKKLIDQEKLNKIKINN